MRDKERLKQAFEMLIIYSCCSYETVDTAEYNPTECIKTNINGAQNVISCALECGVSDVIALSTDKTCSIIYMAQLN